MSELMTRSERATLACDEYARLNIDSIPEGVEPERWLLLEESTIDGSWHATAHPTIEEAITYTDECAEYPQDWEPRWLVDLDTGNRMQPESSVKRVTTWSEVH